MLSHRTGAQTREKPGALWRGEIQRAPSLTIDQIIVPRHTGAHTPNGVSLYAGWLLSRVFGAGQKEGPETRTVGGCRSSGPMIEAGAPSTEEAALVHREGARPTGGSNDRITGDRAQRCEGAKHRPCQV